MAQSPQPASGPDLEEAFLADRQRFWLSWTRTVFATAAFIVFVLIMMTVFLV
jgi:hypothetical protein